MKNKKKIIYKNLEYRVEITPDYPDFKSEDLDKISEAWGLGDYRIWFEAFENLYGEPEIVISASRDIRHKGVNITHCWLEIRKQLENGEIPDKILEKALKERKA